MHIFKYLLPLKMLFLPHKFAQLPCWCCTVKDKEFTSALKMETVCFSEALVSICDYTWHQTPEEQHCHPHCHENLKLHKEFKSSNGMLSYQVPKISASCYQLLWKIWKLIQRQYELKIYEKWSDMWNIWIHETWCCGKWSILHNQ
jgi:hypothetical protein